MPKRSFCGDDILNSTPKHNRLQIEATTSINSNSVQRFNQNVHQRLNSREVNNSPRMSSASRIKFLENENELLRNKLIENLIENAKKTKSLEERFEMLEEKNKKPQTIGKFIKILNKKKRVLYF
jgi:hypothetical protein